MRVNVPRTFHRSGSDLQTTAAVACLVSILACACSGGGQKGQGEKAGGGKGGGRGPVTVKIEKIQAQRLPRIVEVVSVLAGVRQAEVYSRVTGRVSFIGPREGQKVKQGELIAKVDRSDPGQSFLETPIQSPISGWVGRWAITSIGTQVTAQQPIVTVVDDTVLNAQVMLPTNEWVLVSEATPVKVRVGGEGRQARVSQIARAAEPTSGRGKVTVEIDNKDAKWKVGMVASVSFEVDPRDRVVVPASAIAITDQGAFVFVVEEGNAKRLKVDFRTIDNDDAEVLDALKDGDQLITEGVNQVSDKLPVRIMESPGS